MTMVYLLEDDVDLAEEVSSFLTDRGYEVEIANSIRAFSLLCAGQLPDIAILDRTLPDGDGILLLGELRRLSPHLGVVMFTAKGSIEARIEGLESGADHYLPKPVRLQELAAVLQAIERRLELTLRWQLSWMRCELRTAAGETIRLTGQETSFLRALLLSTGRVVPRRKVVELMGKNFLSYDLRNLDTLLLRLRKKVLTISAQSLPVKTMHGSGYMASSRIAMVDD